MTIYALALAATLYAIGAHTKFQHTRIAMKKMIVVVLLSALAGCAEKPEPEIDADCSVSMSNTRTAYGEPEEWTSYDADGYHSRSWWYWSIGFERSFAWGSDVEGCNWSDYNFTPII